jgi:hypothetical protein
MPLLTPLQSAACSSLLTLSYVGGLYISASTRVGSLVPASSADVGADDTPASAAADAAPRRRGKNDEDVVYARLRTVGIVSVAGVGATIAVLWQAGAARESVRFAHTRPCSSYSTDPRKSFEATILPSSLAPLRARHAAAYSLALDVLGTL